MTDESPAISPIQRLQTLYGVTRQIQLTADQHAQLLQHAQAIEAVLLAAEKASIIPGPGSVP